MKGYSGFEARQSRYLESPPEGAYEAQIQGVRLERDSKNVHDVLVLMIEIMYGDYANRYHELYESKKSRFGGDAKYPGVFRLTVPNEDEAEDGSFLKRRFENAMFCIEQSNPGYHWAWDERSLKGKGIGISIRKRLYNYNGKDYEGTEIGQLETLEDVISGKCKVMKPRDSRPKEDAPVTAAGGAPLPPGYSIVEDEEVPF